MRLNFQQQTTAASLSALAHLGIAYLLLASVFASPPTPPKLLPIAVTLIPPKAFAKSAVATAPAVSAAPVVEAAPPPVIPPLAAAQPEVAPPKPIPKPKPALKPKPKPDPALKSKPKPESRPKLASVARPESLIQQVEDRYVLSLPLGQGAEMGNSAAAESRATPLPGNPKPTYPAFARRLGHEGRVIIRVRVLPTGIVGAADIARSSGYAVLDEAALTTIKRWRFRPAQQSGQTVGATLDVPISFRLHDQG
ncbi:MAG: TonB family protein [Candidatus Contendobacter sp.]|jgi:protein TonB|nr:energy transducer TonB [Gammaproteobacteria bacterium]MCC8994433.1 TonB family protein [Candidatus Contendobacter sp.]